MFHQPDAANGKPKAAAPTPARAHGLFPARPHSNAVANPAPTIFLPFLKL